MFCKADEEVRSNEFGLAHFGAADEVCSECLADRTGRPFTALGPDALWRGTEGMDFGAYRARIRAPAHPVVASPLFCHRWFFMFDIMHMLDCHGVAEAVYGGVLAYLLRDARLGANMAQRLGVVNRDRTEHYRGRSHKLPEIWQANCVQSKWGILHGATFKAAILRHACLFFKELVDRHCVSDGAADVLLRQVMAAFLRINTILWDGPMFLDDAEMTQLRSSCEEFGVCYSRLRELSRQEGILAWPIRPKTHKTQHIPFMAQCLNPRHCQCYGEESAMGELVKTWQGSKAGRYFQVVQTTVLVKRLTGFLLRFELALLD